MAANLKSQGMDGSLFAASLLLKNFHYHSLAGFRVVLFLRVGFDFSLSLIRDSKGNTCLVTQGGRADVL